MTTLDSERPCGDSGEAERTLRRESEFAPGWNRTPWQPDGRRRRADFWQFLHPVVRHDLVVVSRNRVEVNIGPCARPLAEIEALGRQRMNTPGELRLVVRTLIIPAGDPARRGRTSTGGFRPHTSTRAVKEYLSVTGQSRWRHTKECLLTSTYKQRTGRSLPAGNIQ
jgi:hypothetical protein